MRAESSPRREGAREKKREPSGETLQTNVTYFRKSLGPPLPVPINCIMRFAAISLINSLSAGKYKV